MNENFDLADKMDEGDQVLPPVFVKIEETQKDNDKEVTDYSKVYVLPSIKTRFFSMLIDIVVIFLISLAISSLFEKIGQVPNYVRVIVFVIVVILYEPILVSLGSTVGQLVLNIRVRNFRNPDKRLVFHLAVLRLIVKALLGWLSFITVTFNINRRAIHDFAGHSIMISNKITGTNSHL
jgi:hypothetical protein